MLRPSYRSDHSGQSSAIAASFTEWPRSDHLPRPRSSRCFFYAIAARVARQHRSKSFGSLLPRNLLECRFFGLAHHPALFNCLVVVPEYVEQSVNREVGQLTASRVAILVCLAPDALARDDHIA